MNKIPNLTHVITDFCHHERTDISANEIIESILNTRRVSIAVIDSMPPHHFECSNDNRPNIVITPYFGADSLRNSPNCDHWLAGVQYAILDQEYLNLHHSIKQRELSAGKKILICCGGSDPNRNSEFILQLLTEKLSPQINIEVVVGKLFNASRVRNFKNMAKMFPEQISLHIGRSNIADLVADCGVLLGSVGLIRYESACLGKPSFLVQNNSDYEAYLRQFDRAGLGRIFLLQHEDELSRFETIVHNLNSAEHFAEISKPNLNAFELVDGYGVQRILNNFLGVEDQCFMPM